LTRYSFPLLISLVMSFIGALFIFITTYGFYTTRIITSWTNTCFVSVMWIIPLIAYIIKNLKIKKHIFFECIGKASYNIYLFQMVYYRSYRTYIARHIDYWFIDLIVGLILCIIIGLVFYEIEKRITKAILNLINYILD